MDKSRSREEGAKTTLATGSQTLLRGLDLLEAITEGSLTLPELCEVLGLNRSTVHRLASALVDRGYLKFVPRAGYMLGAKLLELGFAARQQIDMPRVARSYLEELSDETGDTVHLGVIDKDKALYLDKISGRRRVEIGSRIGERHPLCSTGLGKALMLDMPPSKWQAYHDAENASGEHHLPEFAAWSANMRNYVEGGYSFDLEENEDRIRCVGAPVRDESGAIVAAISVSSVAQYMDDERMQSLIATVTGVARAISREIGWTPELVRKGK